MKIVGATGLGGLWASIFFWINRLVLTRLIHFSKNFVPSIKIVGTTDLCSLWAVEWAWPLRVTNLHLHILYLL